MKIQKSLVALAVVASSMTLAAGSAIADGMLKTTAAVQDGTEVSRSARSSVSFQERHDADLRASIKSQAAVGKSRISSASAAKRGKRGPRGRQGPQGPQGNPGPAGPAGPAGSVVMYTETSPLLYLDYEDAGEYVATCTQGGRAVSGGFRQDGTYFAFANESAPQNTNQWYYYITNSSASYGTNIYFVTTCAR